MFYKPKFCCNCGEKIERADWRLWTSRRFCDVCEIEQKGHELLPRVIVTTAVLFGIFGVGSYFQGQDAATVKTGVVIPSGSRRTVAMESKQQPIKAGPDTVGLDIGRGDLNGVTVSAAEPRVVLPSKEQPGIRKIASDEPIHFCGAMTKKGKPCSRRVKSNERCWQHAGQPSAAAERKVPDIF